MDGNRPKTSLPIMMKYDMDGKETLGEHTGKNFYEILMSEDGFNFIHWTRWLTYDDAIMEHVCEAMEEESFHRILQWLFGIWYKYFKETNREFDQQNRIIQGYRT